jgi:hypothetical protein
MMDRENSMFTLACLAAAASVLGCVAMSLATVSHAQIATPRFYASVPAAHAVSANRAACDTKCSSVVISR